MKLLNICSFLLCASAVSAQSTLNVKGVDYNVDTVFHAVVGPGTTQTSLQLRASSNPLNVHYLTVDKSTPGVTIRAVCATDKVAGTARTSSMAASKTTDGVTYFAGCNADFFSTSGTSSLGTSVVGTPTTSTTVEREIYKTSNSNYQFTVDNDGVARISRLNYYTGTATIGSKVTLFKGVNVMSPNNGITLYTPRYWGSANQMDYAGNCNQVTAKLVDGDTFYAGGKFRLEVTSEPSTDGDLKVPSDGFVIHGRGTSTTGCNTGAKGFVGALKPGDIVEFDNIILTSDGERIYPRTIVSGNPKNVGGGETLDTEGERTDAKDRHPRTSIGISEDGNKIIMMVVDGRGASVGVTTSMLADIMRYAGAHEAVNLDGGGSSTLYTQALGVRNHCSDGSERAVGNAVFAVLEAPEDNEVAEIRFADWVKAVPYLGEYTPTIYAYNKYGKLINPQYSDYTLEAPAELGSIITDGHALLASGSGTHALRAVAKNGVSASIAVTVGNAEAVIPTLSSVLLNGVRDYRIRLQASMNGTEMPISPEAFQWVSSDPEVARVSADGVVSGISDGKATITGSRDNLSVSIEATVEIAKAVLVPLESTPDAESWTLKPSGSKVTEFLANADGSYSLSYTLTTTRSPKIILNNNIVLWSHPEAFHFTMGPTDGCVTTLNIGLRPANDQALLTVIKDIDESEKDYVVPINTICDPEDLASYPIEFASVSFALKGTTGTPYTISIPKMQVEYSEKSIGGVGEISVDLPEGCPISVDGKTVMTTSPASLITVHNLAGVLIARTMNAQSLTLPEGPLTPCIVSATIGGKTHVAKVTL